MDKQLAPYFHTNPCGNGEKGPLFVCILVLLVGKMKQLVKWSHSMLHDIILYYVNTIRGQQLR